MTQGKGSLMNLEVEMWSSVPGLSDIQAPVGMQSIGFGAEPSHTVRWVGGHAIGFNSFYCADGTLPISGSSAEFVGSF